MNKIIEFLAAVETFIVDSVDALLETSNEISRASKELASDDAQDKEVMDLIGEPEISESLKSEIHKFARNKDSEKVYLALANRSEKYVRYAMYYMSNNNARKIKMNKDDREFVNTLGYYCGYGKIYEYDSVNDINKYDIATCYGIFNAPHMIYLNEIKDRLSAENFQNKWKAKIGAKSMLDFEVPEITTTKPTVDKYGYIHPVFTKIPEDEIKSTIVYPKKPDYMSDDQFRLFDKDLSMILNGKDYYYSMKEDNNWYITVYNNNVENSYMLDDGTIMGGRRAYIMGRYILQSGYTDTIFIDINSHFPIVSKVIDNPFYTLTPEELMLVSSDMFQNCEIYHYIDFNNTASIFENVSNANRGKEMFSRYLAGVVKVLKEAKIDVRLRFAEFNTPTSFILVSDNNCKSTLPGATSTNVIKDFKIIVTPKVITVFDSVYNCKRICKVDVKE